MHHTKDSGAGDDSLLQAIVENTSDDIFAKDLDGRYILVNAALAEFLGKSKKEILGLRDEDLYPAEIARQFVSDDQEVLKTKADARLRGRRAGT